MDPCKYSNHNSYLCPPYNPHLHCIILTLLIIHQALISLKILSSHEWRDHLWRWKLLFGPGCKHVFICCKDGDFGTEVCWDSLTFGVSLKWPLRKRQFLPFSCFMLFQSVCFGDVNTGLMSAEWKCCSTGSVKTIIIDMSWWQLW